jgi:hypothetical protein
MSRIGKIARLPREIRAELNRRLRDGHCGRQLVDWLNSLPEAQAALERDFEGRPINETNLTEWKQGGYREWETHQEALTRAADLAADAKEITDLTRGQMADHLATLLTARYAAELAAWDGGQADEMRRRLRALRDLCRDVLELQRGQQNAARVKLEQVRLERDRQQAEQEIATIFLRWLDFPGVRECARDEMAAFPEKVTRLKSIFGPAQEKPAIAPEASLFTPPEASGNPEN